MTHYAIGSKVQVRFGYDKDGNEIPGPATGTVTGYWNNIEEYDAPEPKDVPYPFAVTLEGPDEIIGLYGYDELTLVEEHAAA